MGRFSREDEQKGFIDLLRRLGSNYPSPTPRKTVDMPPNIPGILNATIPTRMLRRGLRFVACLMMLTVLGAAQCVSACTVSGCHHGDSMDSMPESQHSMGDHQPGHQSHQKSHHGSTSSEPAQHDESCGGGSCGDHTTYLAKAKDTSALEKLAFVSPILLLPVATPVMQIEVSRILASRATHSPPHPRDIGVLSTVLRI